MALSSVSLAYGNVSFAAEAENENWLSDQLDKFLELAKLLPLAATVNAEAAKRSFESIDGEKFTGTLASHLKAKKAEENQNRRFLATADWLRLRGNEKLTTSRIAKALSENQQKRLANPAECLNRNVGKGFCEKTGDGFFVTPEGSKELGNE